jgi:uncharacterized damage-inducible protein DinB
MTSRWFSLALTACTLPALLVAQTAPSPAPPAASTSPVADALRANARRSATNLIASAETMPAERYGFRPTPAQMSFGQVVVHLAEGNDQLCSLISGAAAPQRAKVDTTDAKDKLVARLRETFQFCDSVLAKVDDSKLAEPLPIFGRQLTRANVIVITVADWADHYSQAAIYLRLNGLLPPTARPRPNP